MKFSYILLVFLLAGCTKSETQYRNRDDKMSTVNNKQSDTIQTLPQVADTANLNENRTNVPTDNE